MPRFLLILLCGLSLFAQDVRDLGAVLPVNGKPRVAVIGDFGYSGKRSGADAVARAVLAAHRESPFDFGLTVGDNFYPRGVASTGDSLWKKEFHDRYDALGIRFFAILGNHDYMSNPQAQVDYTQKPGNKTWQMPHRYYTFSAGPVQFFALDTDEGTIGLFGSKPWSDEQLGWLKSQLARHAGAKWKVVYGHHPIYSDGHHGDTKRLIERLLPVLQEHHVDAYIAGHDHDMQHFERDGIQFFIAGGSGQETRKVKRKRAVFARAAHGFMIIEASTDELSLRLIGTGGETVHSKILKK